MTHQLTFDQALQLCIQAAQKQGASDSHAEALAKSIVTAEAEGNQAVGFAHFLDYLEALKAGRIKGDAIPAIEEKTAIIQSIDAQCLPPHLSPLGRGRGSGNV